ncbi:electron transfer flavoprotein subunit beta/FixA family protein [Leifsonia sp. H3M29-4]|uniref:electron transfer flavoprotein subunit beta/FixA family protein n=1 Tax=Salinibacterium metalliresistens TaxID=3031321 RepID=UPI0023DB5AB1|nr:electron transfer flavoprotein subunit beta/FixA family protein [Salinibacterium metalliresistens]MDF1479323.1 electron transfer flavoprotein subunit beta/FixA family protein [Salinibacterium metalliresistens]
MRIIALVKQVPDTWGDRTLDPTTGLLDRDASEAVIDEIGERAIEIALQAKDADKSVEVVVLTMGPADAAEALRKGLAMGADSAIHVEDDALAGADLARTAAVLAAAIERAGADLVVAGAESTDGRGGVLAGWIAELLGRPSLDSLDEVTVSGDTVSGVRGSEHGTAQVHASLPAVIAVTERAAEPRFPNFKGIMSAKKKPLETLAVADLGVETPASASIVLATKERPAREAGRKVVDDGNAAAELAEFLVAARLV